MRHREGGSFRVVLIGFADWRKAFNVNGAVERERFPIRELHQVEVRPVARNISRRDHVPCIRHLHGGVAEICVVQEIEDVSTWLPFAC